MSLPLESGWICDLLITNRMYWKWGLNSNFFFILPKFLSKGPGESCPTNHKFSSDGFYLTLYILTYFPIWLWHNKEESQNVLPKNIFPCHTLKLPCKVSCGKKSTFFNEDFSPFPFVFFPSCPVPRDNQLRARHPYFKSDKKHFTTCCLKSAESFLCTIKLSLHSPLS